MPSQSERASLLAAAAAGVPLGSSLLDSVVEQLPIGVIVAEAPSERIRHVNRYAREALRGALEPGTIAGCARLTVHRRDGTRVAPGDLPLVRALRHGERTDGELLVHERADGSNCVFTVNAFPVVDEHGARVAAAMTIEDVSASERRRRAERDFAANAAHELRTPVASIASAIEVLQAGAKADEELRDLFLGHIERESSRLQRLSRALLLLARADADGEPPRLAVVPLRPLLREVASSAVPARGVRIRVTCQHDLAVLAAPVMLEQALVNVVGNATRFTKTGRIVVSGRADGDRSASGFATRGPG